MNATPFDAAQIPTDILDSTRGVIWRWETRNGKPDKPPYIADDPARHARSNDPTTWRPFRLAVDAVRAGHADGPGFVLGDGFAGVDLDDCRDPQTGVIGDWAQRIIAAIDSYTETSPSQTGVKIWIRIDPTLALRGGKHNRPDGGAVELYATAKYFTVTGAHLPGTPRTIETRTAQFAALHARLFPPSAQTHTAVPSQPGPMPDDDQALIERACAAGNGAKFSALWRGDNSGYGSHSEADAALCLLLAFWTGRDAARIDRLFRASGLMRDKWDLTRGESTYGARTIEGACAACREVYTPRAPEPETTAGSGPTPADDPDSPGLDPAFLSDGADVVREGQRIAAEGIRYLVPDVIPNYGVLGMLVAYAKVGKTTLGQALAAAVAMGRPFLDRDTTPTRVLIIAAEDPPEYTAYLARVLDITPSRLTFYRAPVRLDHDGLAAIRSTVRAGGYGLVLIASWQAVVRGLVRDENDNAGAVNVVEHVKASTRTTGVPWLIDAHSGKGEDQDDSADPSKAMRGASGAAGAADYMLSLRYGNGAFGTQRRLSGKGRFINLAPISLDYDPETGRYTCLGDTKRANVETTWQLVCEMGALDTTPRSLTEIARRCGLIAHDARLGGNHRQHLAAALTNRPGVGRVDELRRGHKTTLYRRLEDA